jgi:L-fuculose-phosphate aldolase
MSVSQLRTNARDVEDVRFKVAAARRILAEAGCESGVGGHVTARAEDHPDTFWTSPFEFFDEALPETVIKCDFALRVLEGEGRPSPSLAGHAAIYAARPDVNAVIHHHGFYVATLSTAYQSIGMYHLDSLLLHRAQGYYDDDGNPPVAPAKLAEAFAHCDVLLIANHGVMVAAESLEAATIVATVAEEAARIHLAAVAIGGKELSDDFAAHVVPSLRRSHIPETWEALVRRLRRTAPELFTAVLPPIGTRPAVAQ